MQNELYRTERQKSSQRPQARSFSKTLNAIWDYVESGRLKRGDVAYLALLAQAQERPAVRGLPEADHDLEEALLLRPDRPPHAEARRGGGPDVRHLFQDEQWGVGPERVRTDGLFPTDGRGRAAPRRPAARSEAPPRTAPGARTAMTSLDVNSNSTTRPWRPTSVITRRSWPSCPKTPSRVQRKMPPSGE